MCWEITENGVERVKIIVHKSEGIISIHGTCSLRNSWDEVNGISGNKKLPLSRKNDDKVVAIVGKQAPGYYKPVCDTSLYYTINCTI